MSIFSRDCTVHLERKRIVRGVNGALFFECKKCTKMREYQLEEDFIEWYKAAEDTYHR